MWPEPDTRALPVTGVNVAKRVETVNSRQIIEKSIQQVVVETKKPAAKQNQVINNAPETRLSINLTGIVAVTKMIK